MAQELQQQHTLSLSLFRRTLTEESILPNAPCSYTFTYHTPYHTTHSVLPHYSTQDCDRLLLVRAAARNNNILDRQGTYSSSMCSGYCPGSEDLVVRNWTKTRSLHVSTLHHVTLWAHGVDESRFLRPFSLELHIIWWAREFTMYQTWLEESSTLNDSKYLFQLLSQRN